MSKKSGKKKTAKQNYKHAIDVGYQKFLNSRGEDGGTFEKFWEEKEQWLDWHTLEKIKQNAKNRECAYLKKEIKTAHNTPPVDAQGRQLFLDGVSSPMPSRITIPKPGVDPLFSSDKETVDISIEAYTCQHLSDSAQIKKKKAEQAQRSFKAREKLALEARERCGGWGERPFVHMIPVADDDEDAA